LPIPVGKNIQGFDLPIIQRLAEEFSDIDKDGKQKLTSSYICVDLEHDFWRLTENTNYLKKFSESGRPDIKIETILKWWGASTEGAHNAIFDVEQTSAIFVKLLKLYRRLMSGDENGKYKVAFEGCMKVG
jgi:hypothetical protein